MFSGMYLGFRDSDKKLMKGDTPLKLVHKDMEKSLKEFKGDPLEFDFETNEVLFDAINSNTVFNISHGDVYL